MRNIYDDGGPMSAEISSKACRRDYEGDIAKLKKDLTITENLSKAIEDYAGLHGTGSYNRKEFTLSELYGAAKLSMIGISKSIDILTEEWQREIDKVKE